jgi:hypothetical protein
MSLATSALSQASVSGLTLTFIQRTHTNYSNIALSGRGYTP